MQVRELRRLGSVVLGALVLCAALPHRPASAQIGGCTPDLSGAVRVDIVTDQGTIPLELYPNAGMFTATVDNFVAYMNAGDYDGSILHRSVNLAGAGLDVIQGGGFRVNTGNYEAITTMATIDNDPCLSNTRGTIAMARQGGNPDSATSQWFINVQDNLVLDTSDGVGFTAFGKVVGNGMAVVDAIHALPTFDARPGPDLIFVVEAPFNQIFSDLPVTSAPVNDPMGYGCWDSPTFYALLDFEPSNGLVPDAVHGATRTLFDIDCDGSGAVGAPSVPCTPGMGTNLGRDVAECSDDLSVCFLPRINMTCDAIAESEESLAARRADHLAQLIANGVDVTSVPAPGPTAAALAALVALGGRVLLTRRRR